jgi:hypothetical protein
MPARHWCDAKYRGGLEFDPDPEFGSAIYRNFPRKIWPFSLTRAAAWLITSGGLPRRPMQACSDRGRDSSECLQ